MSSGVLRPFPSAALSDIDPFVFLDTAAPQRLGGHDIYVRPHAHRGVQPVSLLFRGRIEHRDSLGHHRVVASGGMQWLVSGAGALHEEVLQGDSEGVFHMAQLWVNLPARLKHATPAHHAVDAHAVPTVERDGTVLRVYAGQIGDAVGPAPMPTPVCVAHATLRPGGRLALPFPESWNVAFTVVAGQVDHAQAPLGPGDTAVYAMDGAGIAITSQTGGQVLLMAGEPLNEPIVRGAGFVMNTPAEIEQAHADLHAGRMGHLAPSR
jgi:redox-sensitive bicupin YhaK (pirin superfamily)